MILLTFGNPSLPDAANSNISFDGLNALDALMNNLEDNIVRLEDQSLV